MAKQLHVKAKSPWQMIHIPENSYGDSLYDGLIDIQELTDYEFVHIVKNKKEKRKATEKPEETLPKKPKIEKKPKKENSSASNNFNVKTHKKTEAPENEEAITIVAELKKKIKKVKVKNEEGIIDKKEKKKKENKRTKTKKIETNIDTVNSIKEDYNDKNVTNASAIVSNEVILEKKTKKKKIRNSKRKEEDSKIVAPSTEKDVSNVLENNLKVNINDLNEIDIANASAIVSNEKILGKKKKKKKLRNPRRKKKNTEKDLSNVLENNLKVDDYDKNEIDNTSSSENILGKKKKKLRNPRRKKKDSEKVTPSTEKDLSNGSETIKGPSLVDMSKWSNLFVPNLVLQSLQAQGFDNPTTIQTLTLPSAIRDHKDILAAAETGSGKTFAFGIPLIANILLHQQAHKQTEENDKKALDEENVSDEDVDMIDKDSDRNDDDDDDDDDDENDEEEDNSINKYKNSPKKTHKKSSHPPSGLILEPTRELAVQVYKHLSKLAKFTDIRFALVVGGMSVDKQRRLLRRCPDVIIATPGRLWQLIEEGESHVSKVDLINILVVDEADRMVEKGHYEELTKLLQMINESPRKNSKRQSFVMSATLTMEVPLPRRVLNKVKEKNLEKDKLKMLTDKICVGSKPKVIDLTPKDKTAQSLVEMRINCTATEKDIYLYYFLCQHPGRTLVFANSKDCLRRLVTVFTLLECSPYPLHADMQQRQRLKNLDRFSANSQGLLLASDVAARGLDIPNVDYVLHYQVPHTMENYVHRSGRTARASNVGLSVMLVSPEDARNYRKIVQGVKNGEELPIMPIDLDLIPSVKTRVDLARCIDVTEYRAKKVKLHNDFFSKTAAEMDMILDDDSLIPEDSMEKADEKNNLRAMRQQLSAMLKGSLTEKRMTKYPTKSGQLLTKKSIDLFDPSHQNTKSKNE